MTPSGELEALAAEIGAALRTEDYARAQELVERYRRAFEAALPSDADPERRLQNALALLRRAQKTAAACRSHARRQLAVLQPSGAYANAGSRPGKSWSLEA